MMTTSMFRAPLAAMAVAALLCTGCNSDNPEVKQQITKAGVSEQAASELSRMELTPDEIASIAEAKKSKLDDASITRIVKSVHDRNLKFDLGITLQVLTMQGMGATALTELVDLGALPSWGDDLTALKDAGVGDVTILQLAKLKFEEKKTMLSGSEYASLKKANLSDAALITFAQKGGTYQQVQEISKQLALGKSEQEALKLSGM